MKNHLTAITAGLILIMSPSSSWANMPAADDNCAANTKAGSYAIGDIGGGEISLLVCDSDAGIYKKWLSKTAGGSLTADTITLSNNMGIGTDSPNDPLDVVGNIDVTGCYQISDVPLGLGLCLSDERLKTNIRPIEKNALALIQKLRPVRFEWNETAERISDQSGEDTGFIAQEFEQVLPHLVFTDAETGYKKIKYTQEINFIMVKALQEQQALIEAQAARIDALDHYIPKNK